MTFWVTFTCMPIGNIILILNRLTARTWKLYFRPCKSGIQMLRHLNILRNSVSRRFRMTLVFLQTSGWMIWVSRKTAMHVKYHLQHENVRKCIHRKIDIFQNITDGIHLSVVNQCNELFIQLFDWPERGSETNCSWNCLVDIWSR